MKNSSFYSQDLKCDGKGVMVTAQPKLFTMLLKHHPMLSYHDSQNSLLVIDAEKICCGVAARLYISQETQ